MEHELKIGIITPCYNEEDNLEALYTRIKSSIAELPYQFEILFVDNCSTDSSQSILRELAASDPIVKVIINNRNFGHIRSPYHGILQSQGDATIYLASDLQDPPELIPQFINQWRAGYKLVMGVKPTVEGSKVMHFFRKVYYMLLQKISDIDILKNATGFGLYDKEVIDHVRSINDPYPFLRGLVSELGYDIKQIPFSQPKRIGGLTKNNLFTLYDIGILGLVSHSKTPLRLASFLGFLIGTFSLLSAIVFTILKLCFWNTFPMGVAPIAIGMFLLFGLLFVFVGIVGE